METVLDKDTLEIFRAEIETLMRHNEKYISISPDELDAIVNAFDFTLKNGRDQVRGQMLYDMIQENRDK